MQDNNQYQTSRQILLNPKDSFALSATINPDGATTDSFGHKIIKAGTVLSGDGFNLDPSIALSIAQTTVAVTGVSADSSLAVTVGETVQANASVTPANASDKALEYSSSDTSIFTVDNAGEVTGVKAGTANLIVKAHGDETKTATIAITVS